MSLQIHLSIETLEAIIEYYKLALEESPELSDIIRITKTADRQIPELQDKFEFHMFTTHTEVIEG